MGRLTTHVLDTSTGRPAAGIRIELIRIDDTRNQLLDTIANADGRVDGPLLEGDAFAGGDYELIFHAGDYFQSQPSHEQAPMSAQNRFLDEVVIRFRVADASEHYHVPLLLSPFGYSTYRGS